MTNEMTPLRYLCTKCGLRCETVMRHNKLRTAAYRRSLCCNARAKLMLLYLSESQPVQVWETR
jgi:hypothetical protein